MTDHAAAPAKPLPFRLPPFCRVAWVSDAARSLWEPRFEQVRAALEDLAVLSATERRRIAVRPASVDRLRKLAKTAGVVCTRVNAPADECFATAMGTARRQWIELAARGKRARHASHTNVCACATGDAAAADACDPVWTWALRTGTDDGDGGRSLAVEGRWETNPLLRAIGLAAAQAWPCGPGCEQAVADAAALAEAARAHGRADELDWLQQILSWPMSWSALHGIAEVKTPVLRYVRDTLATPDRLSVKWRGTVMPAAAARGLTFPFPARNRPAAMPAISTRSSA